MRRARIEEGRAELLILLGSRHLLPSRPTNTLELMQRAKGGIVVACQDRILERRQGEPDLNACPGRVLYIDQVEICRKGTSLWVRGPEGQLCMSATAEVA